MPRQIPCSALRMIIKLYDDKTLPQDRRQRAGAIAERQLAHYLHRRFNDDPNVCVLHGLRIEDPKQPEQDGSAGVCQIDHLLVHRWGMFIVESKSATEEVCVRPDGTGGDEWSRVYRGREIGMPSPIRQAQRQSELMRNLLQRHREQLVGKQAWGSRTFTKLTVGTDQRGFRHVPMQLVVAVSDGGRINRLDGWKEPRKPFQVFVTKADLVPDKIAQEMKRHRKGARANNVLGFPTSGEYGLWSMKAEEVVRVAEFLAERHTNRFRADSPQDRSPIHSRLPSHPRPQATVEAVCKHCGSNELLARWGKYGYHWQCRVCSKNTKMPLGCSECGATRQRNNPATKIRKAGAEYFRDCAVYGNSDLVWAEK
ncbi:MAG: NERD domain-containing protein [Gammaproteobacteria bacterium]|nr:NERD domain-containing protein [Gammaproteobacteria bacterium]